MSSTSKAKMDFTKVGHYWKPAMATGTGGTALIVWFEEIIAFATEFIAVVFLPVLVGLIYLFNILVFNEFEPKKADLNRTKE